MNFKLSVACVVLCASTVAAQVDFTIEAPPPPSPDHAVWAGGESGATAVFRRFDAVLAGPGMRFEGEPVKDAPYSAEAITESVQILADGNRIRRENRSLIYRDSQGRTRREESINALGPWSTDGQKKTVFINDPIAGTHYVLNSGTRSGEKLPVPKLADHVEIVTAEASHSSDARNVVINRTVIGNGPRPVPAIAGRISAIPLPGAENTTEEDLGSRLIEGVQAVGKRLSTTIPAKSIGADRDIVITFERWHSEELKVDVLTKRNDPRVGETTYRLTNINRTEPLPSLFEPPADFDINEANADGNVFFQRKLAPPPPPQQP